VFPHSPQAAGAFVIFARPFAQRADRKANLAHDKENSARSAFRFELLPKNHASVSAIEQNFVPHDVVALTMQHCGRCATMEHQSASQPPLRTALPRATASRYSIGGAVRGVSVEVNDEISAHNGAC
jgi:hypothetical protein